MASRLHSKKNTKTKTKPKRETKTTTTKKKWKNKESFPLTRCWGHVLWADDVKLLLSAQGKLKPKHLSLFIIGGGGGKKEWRDHMVFRGTEWGEKQSLLTEYKGGGAIRHWLSMRGIIKILQRFGGGTRLISVWYNKNPPLGNIYSDWS